MLQKKEYQQQQRYNKTKIPVTPTKTNVTKEGIPTKTVTPTKTNVTKEGIPTTTKIPVTPTKTNVTKEGIPTTTNTNNNKDTSNTDKN